MRSPWVSIVMAAIALGFAGAAYYYWTGGGNPANKPVKGVVITKFEREPGTEAGGQTLDQGMRLLTGESLKQEVYYFVRIRTASGEELDIEVPKAVYTAAKPGDTLKRESKEAVPVLVPVARPAAPVPPPQPAPVEDGQL